MYKKELKISSKRLKQNIRKYKRGDYYFRVGIAITADGNEILTNL